MHEKIKTTKFLIEFSQHFIYLTEWFQQQTEFTTEFDTMEVNEMNKCLSKLYVSVRRKDGTYYKRNSLTTKKFPSAIATCSAKPIKPFIVAVRPANFESFLSRAADKPQR